MENTAKSLQIVKLTEMAGQQVQKLIEEDGRPGIGLRLGVKGGGCSGLSYMVDFDTQRDSDYIDVQFGFKVFVDPKSGLYLKDVELDYQGGLTGKGFTWRNPNASNTCGCGESFSV
ncbi:MAG: iron-sulfur cluster assembly accessory protein [bacterium]|nr:iron-sulfur cluster assembly accessory protein [bacterium]